MNFGESPTWFSLYEEGFRRSLGSKIGAGNYKRPPGDGMEVTGSYKISAKLIERRCPWQATSRKPTVRVSVWIGGPSGRDELEQILLRIYSGCDGSSCVCTE